MESDRKRLKQFKRLNVRSKSGQFKLGRLGEVLLTRIKKQQKQGVKS